jgi:hypothetical protein
MSFLNGVITWDLTYIEYVTACNRYLQSELSNPVCCSLDKPVACCEIEFVHLIYSMFNTLLQFLYLLILFTSLVTQTHLNKYTVYNTIIVVFIFNINVNYCKLSVVQFADVVHLRCILFY